MRHHGFGKLVAVLIFAGLAASNVHSQESSRAQTIADEQARKAAELKPYTPGIAERIFLMVQQDIVAEPKGFAPTFDSAYPGGGFTVGASYRKFIGDESTVDVTGHYSIKSYKKAAVGLESRGLARGRAAVRLDAGWLDATEVDYYGLGIDTTKDGRANYRMKEGYVVAGTKLHPLRWTVFEGGVGYERYTLAPGLGSTPSIEESHNTETAPGLGLSPSYVRATATAGLDWRTAPGYTRRGGLAAVTFNKYFGLEDAPAFSAATVDVVQHFPLLRETWVVSLRGELQTVLGDGSAAPYFLLPSLGGGHSLRAYKSFRFQDQSTALMTAEWRWIPNRLVLDLALFYDAGTVADDMDRLTLGSLKTDVGVGVRFHGPLATPLRVELTKGSDGWHVVFAGSAAF